MEQREVMDRTVAISRIYTCLVTKENALPGTPDCKEAYWVVQGSDNKNPIVLQKMESGMMFPDNVIIMPTVEDALAILKTVGEKVMPYMSTMSGVLFSVAHAEAVYDLATGAIGTRLMPFAEKFLSLKAIMEAKNEPVRHTGYANVKLMPPLEEKREENVEAETNGDETMPTSREM